MKIAIIGATGFVGSHILKESLKRGHEVTAIARHTEKLEPQANLKIVQVDVNNVDEFAKAISGHDAVLSAVRYSTVEGFKLLEAIRKSGVKHFLVSGSGAGLEYEPGKLLVDHPQFPEEYVSASRAGIEFYKNIMNLKDIKWSYFAPAAELIPGESRGDYKLGREQLIFDEKGRSWITVGDLAVAILNEAEKPEQVHHRTAIGY